MNAIIDQQREQLELVERVARGIWDARLNRARRLNYGAAWCSWDVEPDTVRDAVREEARGAIAAMPSYSAHS